MKTGLIVGRRTGRAVDDGIRFLELIFSTSAENFLPLVDETDDVSRRLGTEVVELSADPDFVTVVEHAERQRPAAVHGHSVSRQQSTLARGGQKD